MSREVFSNYIPTVDAILSVSDLETITVKRIRFALQALFDIDLTSDKKAVNNMIMERYHKLVDGRERAKALKELNIDTNENAEEDGDVANDLKDSLDELARKDQELAFKLQRSMNSRNLRYEEQQPKRKRAKSTAKEPKEKKKRSQSENHPFMRPNSISPELAEFLQVDAQEKLPRPHVIKKLWDYIKEHDLQNPNDRREIICDERMQPLFGKKQTMFSINKVISGHLHRDDEE